VLSAIIRVWADIRTFHCGRVRILQVFWKLSNSCHLPFSIKWFWCQHFYKVDVRNHSAVHKFKITCDFINFTSGIVRSLNHTYAHLRNDCKIKCRMVSMQHFINEALEEGNIHMYHKICVVSRVFILKSTPKSWLSHSKNLIAGEESLHLELRGTCNYRSLELHGGWLDKAII